MVQSGACASQNGEEVLKSCHFLRQVFPPMYSISGGLLVATFDGEFSKIAAHYCFRALKGAVTFMVIAACPARVLPGFVAKQL